MILQYPAASASKYLSIGFTALWGILHDRKYTHSQANRMHYTAIRCFTKELHKSNNYFTLFTSFALQRRKLVIFNPLMYKNRQHTTEAECCLFCCPILLSRCRFCSFLKLLSYRHTAKSVSFFITKGPFSTAENTPAFRAEQRGAEHACAPQGPLLYVQKRSENT